MRLRKTKDKEMGKKESKHFMVTAVVAYHERLSCRLEDIDLVQEEEATIEKWLRDIVQTNDLFSYLIR